MSGKLAGAVPRPTRMVVSVPAVADPNGNRAQRRRAAQLARRAAKPGAPAQQTPARPPAAQARTTTGEVPT